MVSLLSFTRSKSPSSSSTTSFLLAFCCLSLMICCSSAAPTPLRCWNGVSNPKASAGYPPEEIDCITAGYVCQLTYVANLGLYSMSCLSNTTCQRMLSDFTSGKITNYYDHIKCCNVSRCNAAPDMPNSGGGLLTMYGDANFHWSTLILVLGAHFMRSSFFDNSP